MDADTVKEIKGQEMLDIMYSINSYAFHASPPLTDKEDWQTAIKGREGATYFAYFSDNHAKATAATTEMTQNVRGKIFPAGGVWGVATLPESRRKGYSRETLKKLLASERRKGRAFSCLYPFRGSFYERLGYITFPQARIAKFKPQNIREVLKIETQGEVLLRPISEGLPIFQEYARKLQARTHGMALFNFVDIENAKKRDRWWVAEAVIEKQTCGIIYYDLRGERVMNFNLRALYFYFDNSMAKYLLLKWLASHIDQASQIELWLPASEFPETWLADLRPDELAPAFLAPMGRIVNVEMLNGLPLSPGNFSAFIFDPICPWNEGHWTFDSSDGTLSVLRTKSSTFNLSIQGLSALVYGTHDPGDFMHLDWGTLTPTDCRNLRQIFQRKSPHLHEIF